MAGTERHNMRVELIQKIEDCLLTRADGTIREDYTLDIGEYAEAGYMGNAPTPDDLYIITVHGRHGTVRARNVSRCAFEVLEQDVLGS